MALHHAKPGEVVDLRPLGNALATTRSHAIVRTPDFEAIRLIVPAGSEIPAHDVEGEIMLHCLEGHVRIGLGENASELRAGDWLYLEGGKPHSIAGLEDASLLLTILFQN